MRVSLCFILVFMFFGRVSAQTDSTRSKFSPGVAISTSFSYSIRLTHSPLFTFSNYRHQFELGPKFSFQNSLFDKNRIGVEFNYKFYPNTKAKKLTSFFLLNSSFFNKALERNYIQEYGSSSQEYLVNQKATRRYYDVHLGYGIQYNFVPKFYISTSIGLGLSLEDYDDNRVSSNTELSSYKGYFMDGLNLRGAFTIGYTF